MRTDPGKHTIEIHGLVISPKPGNKLNMNLQDIQDCPSSPLSSNKKLDDKSFGARYLN
jgi:hypothetical protein